MKPNSLLVGKCIREAEGLNLGQYYIIEEVNVGQSHSSVVVNGIAYNSIYFEYYNEDKKEVNIYEEYSPYKRVNKHAKYTDAEREILIKGYKLKIKEILDVDKTSLKTFEDLKELLVELTNYVEKLIELGAEM